MDGQANGRLDRVEALIEQLALADRRLQERQEGLQKRQEALQERQEALQSQQESLHERQEALEERQEALAQSVELLTSLHRDNETRVAALMDTMNRLANIVISHDQRLDDLENR